MARWKPVPKKLEVPKVERPRLRRVDPDEARQRWERRSAQMGAIARKPSVITSLTAVLLAGGIVAGSVSLSNGSTEYDSLMSQGRQQTRDLSAQLDQVRQAQSQPADTKTVSQTLASAQQAGAFVAVQQNLYNRPDANSTAISKAMAPMFSKDSARAATAWYSSSMSNVDASGKAPYVWGFVQTYAFSGDRMNVTWLCRDTQTSDVLAFATGIYRPATKTFEDMTWGVTTKGARRIASEDKGIPDPVDPGQPGSGIPDYTGMDPNKVGG